MMSKRCLALALSLVMALALFVPAQAAVPMLGEGAARAETPVSEAVATAHSHSAAVAETPAVNDAERAQLMACTCETTPHTKSELSSGVTVEKGSVHYIASSSTLGTTNLYFTFSTSDVGAYADWTFEGVWNTGKLGANGTNGFKGRFTGDGTAYVKKGNETILTLIVGTPTHNHSWNTTAAGADADGWVVTKPATCSGAGTKERTCTAAGCPLTNSKEQATIPALEHTWNDGVVTTPATCTTPGVKTFTCTVCTNTKTEVINPAHQYNANGVCTVCGQHQHQWNAGTVTTPATCGEEGEMTYSCTVQGCTETDTQPIPATGKHNFVSGVCSVCGARETTGFLTAAGDLESAYATWPIGAGVTKYEAYVIDASGKESKVDAQLVREYPGYMRVDVLGLKAGKYTIKIKDNNGKEMTTDPLTVKAHERTGFAFVGGTASGAYNEDGTLKSNAQVIYITKGSELEAYQSSGVWSGKDDTQKGKPPKAPTCVRIIGLVELSDAAQFQDWTGGLTIEGVGNDAMLTGGGIFVKGCSNMEVRNLGVKHVPTSGKNDLIAIEQTNDHIWVHNCDYFYGFAGSGDQAKGDGSLDVKESHYCTFSYNHFWDSGKCSLLGMHNDQDYMTYHHNWFDHSDSRHPRIRVAKRVHVYNNYYDGVSKYGVGAAENSGAFVEANYFRNTKYPMLIAMQGSDIVSNTTKGTFSGEPGGIIKAYNNIIIGAKALIPYDATNAPVEFDAYVAKSRDEKVPSSVSAKKGGTTYTNFDTEIDIGVTASQVESPADARLTVTQWAGRVQGGDLVYEFDDATEDTNYAVIDELTDMLNNYKSTLVSVGGTVTNPVSGSTPAEHTHTAGPWVIVTTPGCDPKTQEVVNGQETQSCIICAQVMTTRSVPGAHSNDGSGKCTVCGKTVSNNEGPTVSGGTSGPTLQAKNFKMTDAAQSSSTKSQEDLLASEIAGVADGYFSLTPGAKSVYKRTSAATTAGATTEWIQLPQSGTGGIQFTVTSAPATLKVKFSSTSATDDKQSSTLVVKNSSGTAIANTDGKTASTTKKTSKESNAVTVTFENLAAGTYQIFGSNAEGNTVRVYSISVTETEGACDHAATTHHPAVDATCVKDGNIEYWTCDSCKKNFSDAACTKAVDDVTIEATGAHTWSEWSEADENGEQSRYCEDCDAEETRLGGNLGETGNQVIWVLDDAGKLTITNTDNHIAQDDTVLVALWGDNDKFLGVKIIRASQLTATVGRNWDHLQLMWVNSKCAPQCQAKTVSAIN